MFWNVSSGPVEDITLKWELALRLSSEAKAPKEVLQAIFQGVMQQIEKKEGRKIEASIKVRVWEKVSKEKLKNLREVLIFEVCDKILSSFNNEIIRGMLEEHKKDEKIICYSSELQRAYNQSYSLVIDAVVEKATSMISPWVPEIIDALKEERINSSDLNLQ